MGEREFEVRVTWLLSPNAARVWREPDSEFPDGRAYGLQLTRVVDVNGSFYQPSRDDILSVRVEPSAPEKITLARILKRAPKGAVVFAHA